MLSKSERTSSVDSNYRCGGILFFHPWVVAAGTNVNLKKKRLYDDGTHIHL